MTQKPGQIHHAGDPAATVDEPQKPGSGMRHSLDTLTRNDFGGLGDIEQESLIPCLHGEPHLLAVVVRARALGTLGQLALKFTQGLPPFLPVRGGESVVLIARLQGRQRLHLN